MKMRMFLGMMLAVGMCGAQNLLENGDFTVQNDNVKDTKAGAPRWQ